MALSLNASEIWTGSQAITFQVPLNLDKDQFTELQAGQILKVSYEDASDGIELKVPDLWHHLSGSRRDNAWISGTGTYETYLTPAGVADVQAHGLQIVGAHFTCTKVEVIDGKALSDIKEGTAWTGFCWMNNTCGSMEFFKDNFTQFDLANVKAIRFYCSPEAAGSTYNINLKKTWDSDITSKAGSGLMTELTLTDSIRTKLAEGDFVIVQLCRGEGQSIRTKLAEGDFVIVQLCRGEGQDFNLIDIVLVPNDDPTAIEQTNANAKATKSLRNGMLVIEKNGKFYNTLGVEVK